jgi:DNA (cytosine-5)-methyltransferase 1
MNKPVNREFTYIDLFAGIGGMRIPFQKLGGKCLLTSEIDQYAYKTYCANFDQDHEYIPDVTLINEQDLPKYDVLLAGFPCQPYSIAGLRKGLDDVRGGDIFKKLISILHAPNKPHMFLMENVKGITSSAGTLGYMVEKFDEAGFVLRPHLMNTKLHTHIPQNRERIFFVGFNKETYGGLEDTVHRFEFPGMLSGNDRGVIAEFLEPGPVHEKYYYDARYDCTAQLEEAIPKDSCGATLYQWRRKYVRENKDMSCPTLTANMGSGGHNVPLLRDKTGRVRKLTPRECANFQGFDKKFNLPADVSDNQLYHQIGNSVTVPLVERIAHRIVAIL